ncbi:hypothetical protein [Aneurinibacillus aneurinilyticus]|uniref:hypothetical protein n=1 Tax=Aneurinibacillus aneurinilyticus TaxID=1391 RepID=UPI003525BAE1
MIIHKVEERRGTRRRVPSSFSHKEETNRRPFGARCGDDSLWIILDNQHPCNNKKQLFYSFPLHSTRFILTHRITPTFKIGYIYLILKYKRTFSYIFLQNLTQKIVFNLYTSDLIHRHMFVAEGKNTY